MEDPVAEIPHVIHLLTQSTPSVQKATIEKFFTRSASFTHSFCRTGSFDGSRWLIVKIYQFYKIMSPRIGLDVESVALDSHTLTLYVTISQVFSIFLIPLYSERVRLTTVLSLTTTPDPSPGPRTRAGPTPPAPQSPTISTSSTLASDPDPPRRNHEGNGNSNDEDENEDDDGNRKLYYISAQNDLYQVTEFVKFVMPWNLGVSLVTFWQMFATMFCVFGAWILWPITWAEEREFLPIRELNPNRVFVEEKRT